MKGFKYQLKSILRNKMCILTFLLPVIAGLAIHLLSGTKLSSISENSYGVLENGLGTDTVKWLEGNGIVTVFESMEMLEDAVRDPATQMIGILQNGEGRNAWGQNGQDEYEITTLLSGDELNINKVIADTLPGLFAGWESAAKYDTSSIQAANDSNGLINLLMVIAMVTAMFMGCTFNAMSIISEKEDGIEFINMVLPMSPKDHVIQKMALGFLGGTLSTGITAMICMRVETGQILPLAAIVLSSAFIAALMGLFIGKFSKGLMVGIVYIKMVMILFLAPPILFYLAVPAHSMVRGLSFLLPSSATFYALMDLLNGQSQNIGPYLLVLLAHCMSWLFLYLAIQKASLTSRHSSDTKSVSGA